MTTAQRWVLVAAVALGLWQLGQTVTPGPYDCGPALVEVWRDNHAGARVVRGNPYQFRDSCRDAARRRLQTSMTLIVLTMVGAGVAVRLLREDTDPRQDLEEHPA